MPRLRLLLALLITMGSAYAAQDRTTIPLQAPLATVVPAAIPLSTDAQRIVVRIDASDSVAASGGVSAWASDQSGTWFQTPGQPLRAGEQTYSFAIDRLVPQDPVRLDGPWRQRLRRYGIVISGGAAGANVAVSGLTAVVDASVRRAATTHRVLVEELPAFDSTAHVLRLQTGQRWQCALRPDPLPATPVDVDRFHLSLILTHADGTELRIPGFHHQPINLVDRGDAEIAQPAAAGRFSVRWRPRRPGRWQARLQAVWDDHTVTSELPPIIVSGEPWDDYLRVADTDPRFLVRGVRPDVETPTFTWPIGINLRSLSDERAQRRLHTSPTLDRGSRSYGEYFARFAAAGITHVEIWMAAWNLALEWRPDYPGFGGIGHYHHGNAARLDRVLDLAWQHGIRITLVINNHGQMAARNDAEWNHHPYHIDHGGFARHAVQWFTHPKALAAQRDLRRYLVARYGDHPGLLMWKLSTEIDLTDQGYRTRHNSHLNLPLYRWHRQAADHLQALDTYDHPVTTHWSSDYRQVDPHIAGLPQIDVVSIDAYHFRHRPQHGTMLAQLLWESAHNPVKGIHRRWDEAKPVAVTEYGGAPQGAPVPQLISEHRQGPWAAWFSGHAAAPLLWWFEWVDQAGRWGSWRAISSFIAGEDLRTWRTPIAVPTRGSQHTLWSRAWVRRGEAMGYLLEQSWGWDGEQAPTVHGAELVLSRNADAGDLHLSWWDADRGGIIQERRWHHDGGALIISVPPFARHLAWKLQRR